MNQDEIDLDSINYRGIIKDLLKNWWMIILAGASLWLAVTGVGELIYVPQYTVSSTLVVPKVIVILIPHLQWLRKWPM